MSYSFLQPETSTVLTEEDIFSLPNIIDNPGPAGGDVGDVRDGAADVLAALELEDSEISEVLNQTLLMNWGCVADVRDEAVTSTQPMQPANLDGQVQWVHNVPSDDHAMHVTGSEQRRTPKKGRLEREVQECRKVCRPRQRQAKASSTLRPIQRKQKRNSPELQRRRATASKQRSNGLRKPMPGRRWKDIEREKAQMAVMYAQRRAALSISELCRLRYVPSTFPNSRLKHPFRLSLPAGITPMADMYAVPNSSDFGLLDAAPVQQASTAATQQVPDYISSPTPVQFTIANPLFSPASLNPPPVPTADHFTVVPTTTIDPFEVSMAALRQVSAPALALPNHISETSLPSPAPVQFFENQRHPTLIGPGQRCGLSITEPAMQHSTEFPVCEDNINAGSIILQRYELGEAGWGG